MGMKIKRRKIKVPRRNALSTGQLEKEKIDDIMEKYNMHLKRHNPQPLIVKHIYGLQNEPVCNVNDEILKQYLGSLGVSPTTHGPIDPLKRLPELHLRQIPYREKAIPSCGLVRIQEPWRHHLMEFTNAVVMPLIGQGRPLSRNVYDMHPAPILRPLTYHPTARVSYSPRPKSTAQGDSRLISPTTDGLIPASPSRPTSSMTSGDSRRQRDDGRYIVIEDEPDYESQIFSILGQILEVESLESLQTWLTLASEREKVMAIALVREVLSSRSQNDLDTIPEEPDDTKHEHNLKDTKPQSSEVDRFMLHDRPITELHSPLIYRPKTVSSLVTSRPDSRKPLPQIHQSNDAIASSGDPKNVLRMRYSRPASTESSIHGFYKDTGINT